MLNITEIAWIKQNSMNLEVDITILYVDILWYIIQH